jgi:predicted LPLAT superfamily acyltransferase
MASNLPDSVTAVWAHTNESGSARQLRLMRWMALQAPNVVTNTLIWFIALIYASQKKRLSTRASSLYLRRVLGRKPTLRDLHLHAFTFAHVFVDRVRFLSEGTRKFRIDATGQQLVVRQHAKGRGGILLSAHLGSFEALRAFDRDLPGLRVRYLMLSDHAPSSSALLKELNTDTAERVISLADGLQAMLEVQAALGRGEFVAFLGDRQLRTSRRSQLNAPFLGTPINLPASPYIAAILAGVPLYLCVAPRLGMKHYGIEITQLYDGSPVPRAGRTKRIEELATDFAAHLERLCQLHPYNWFNFFDIWSGSHAVYGSSTD